MFTANEQSLNGVLEVVRRADAQRVTLTVDRARLRVLPVATRFEAAVEVELAHKWMGKFEERLPPLLATWSHKDVKPNELINHLLVPYVAHWSFGERLPVVEEDIRHPLTIGYAFETLAGLVGNRLERTDLLVGNRQAYVNTARLRSDVGAPSSIAYPFDVYVGPSGARDRRVLQLREGLRERGFRVMAESDHKDASAPLTQARNFVPVIDGSANPFLEDEVRRFLNVALGGNEPRLVMPVRLEGEDGSAAAGLQSLDVGHASDGDMDRAVFTLTRRMREQQMQLNEATFGPAHPNTLAAMDSVAELAAEADDASKALAVGTRAVRVREEHLGVDHSDTLRAQLRLTDVLERADRDQEALDLAAGVVGRLEADLGADHPDTLFAQLRVAELLDRVGRRDDARGIAEHVAQARTARLGPHHPDTERAVALLEELERQEPPQPQEPEIERDDAQRRVRRRSPGSASMRRRAGRCSSSAGSMSWGS